MKKTFYPRLLVLTCIATLLLAGCQKDSTTLRLYAANFGGNGKVYMVNRLPHWAEDDAVWCDDADNDNHLATVSEVSSDGTATISVLSVNDGYRLIYPYNIVTSVDGFQATLEIPSVQRYYEVDGKQVVNAPMAAYTSNGSSVHFHNLGALIAINIYNNTEYPNLIIDKVIVSSASENLPLWGTATVDDISSNAPSYHCDANSIPSGEDPYSISLVRYDEYGAPIPIYTFNRTSNNTSSSYKQVYVYVPDHGSVDNRYTITIVARSSSTVSVNDPDCIRTQTQQSPRGGNLERNQMASITYDMFEVHAPTGAIPESKFTINSDGDQVYFAAGNLQYQRSTGIWRIAPNQWDFVGGSYYTHNNTTNQDYETRYGGNVTGSTNNSINDASYQGWIDLFGWGTSGYNCSTCGATYYLPYEWDFPQTNAALHSRNFYGYGPYYHPSDNSLGTTSLSGDPYGNFDWGVFNSSQLGANATWRTLTQSEWSHLLTVRTINGQAGKHHTWSPVKYIYDETIEGGHVFGIVIYPDGYTGQILTTSTSPVATITVIPSGCVFLPRAGQRNVYIYGTSIRKPQMNSSGYGYYWSVDAVSSQKAYCLRLNVSDDDGEISLTNPQNRYMGQAVRLVAPVINQVSNN